MIVNAIGTTPCPMPIGYGGWSQVLADFGCVDAQHVSNMVCAERKARKKVIPEVGKT